MTSMIPYSSRITKNFIDRRSNFLSDPLSFPSFGRNISIAGESNFPLPSRRRFGEKCGGGRRAALLIHPSFPDHLNTDSICLPLQPLYLTCARTHGGRIFPRASEPKRKAKPFESNEKRLSFRRAGGSPGIHGVMAARETKRNHPPSKIGPQTIESLRTHTYHTDRRTEQQTSYRSGKERGMYCANVDREVSSKLCTERRRPHNLE